MKSALVFAVAVCAVSCLQLVKADTSVSDFQTSEMQQIAIRLDESVKKIRVGLTQKMNSFANPANIKKGLTSFDNLVLAMINAKPECVTEGMATLSSSSFNSFAACLPDQAAMNALIQQGHTALNSVFEQLKIVDQQMLAVSDPVIRAEMAAQADTEIAGDFYLKITEYVFTQSAAVQKCIKQAATDLRNAVLSNISSMTKCYASPSQ